MSNDPEVQFNPRFQECASCAAKSGSPELCAACLHNRTVIDRLRVALNAQHLDARVQRRRGFDHGWDARQRLQDCTQIVEAPGADSPFRADASNPFSAVSEPTPGSTREATVPGPTAPLIRFNQPQNDHKLGCFTYPRPYFAPDSLSLEHRRTLEIPEGEPIVFSRDVPRSEATGEVYYWHRLNGVWAPESMSLSRPFLRVEPWPTLVEARYAVAVVRDTGELLVQTGGKWISEQNDSHKVNESLAEILYWEFDADRKPGDERLAFKRALRVFARAHMTNLR